jgi:predicted PurR-regulated permease PerM
MTAMPRILGRATIGFFIVYRLAEDYVIVPRIIGQAVQVPAVVTVVAALLGGALHGIMGALVAIPAAAALLLLTRRSSSPASTAPDYHRDTNTLTTSLGTCSGLASWKAACQI